MPDISMCVNHNCASKNACYRFRAIPNEFQQTYMMFSPDPKDPFGRCADFLQIYMRDPRKLAPIQSNE